MRKYVMATDKKAPLQMFGRISNDFLWHCKMCSAYLSGRLS